MLPECFIAADNARQLKSLNHNGPEFSWFIDPEHIVRVNVIVLSKIF
jgi:hypothetical protein